MWGEDDRKEGTMDETEEQQAFRHFIPFKAAKGRQTRSGGAKPEEAAHGQRFYICNVYKTRKKP
jgi:hypothetical protein